LKVSVWFLKLSTYNYRDSRLLDVVLLFKL